MYPQLPEVWEELRNQRQEQEQDCTPSHLLGCLVWKQKVRKVGMSLVKRAGSGPTYLHVMTYNRLQVPLVCSVASLSTKGGLERFPDQKDQSSRPQSEKQSKGDKMWRDIWLPGTVVFLTLFRIWSQLETTDYTQRLAKSTTVNMDQSDWASIHPCDVLEQESQPPTCSRGTAHTCVKWKVE